VAAKASSAPFSTLPAGYLLSGRYSIQWSLGQGGFGITYLAYDTKLEVEVCVKELFVKGSTVRLDGERLASQDLEVGVFDGWRRRFLSEARSLARYDHANIVRVMDLFEGNGTAYMVMEYVRGMSLKQRLSAGGSMAEVDALAIMGSLLDAVELVHASGQLHRDIKPDNVLLTDSGRVVLIDFGAARDFSEGGSDTHSVQLTPGYAPPEQYSTRARRGPFTDVYALGATLYFLLTGEKPLAATDRTMEELPSPRSLNGEVSEGVSEAVMRALALRPEDRYATVEALRKGLAGRDVGGPAAPGSGGSVGGTGESKPGSGGRSRGRSRGSMAGWVVVGLVVLGLGGLWVRSVQPGQGSMTDEADVEVAAPVFACGQTVDYQGYAYRTVEIGTQCWFQENLRTERYLNGDAIPGGLSDEDWTSTDSGARAIYDDYEGNLKTYGRLYNWYAVNDPRCLCPVGWHVPTDAEWTELTNHLGGEEVAGKKMKTSTWNGTNSSGFSALPGGYGDYDDGSFDYEGYRGYWWSSSAYGAANAWCGVLYSDDDDVYRSNGYGLRIGFSVRCVRDE
jgi:uncharacterized protein (TIGR02145 family)